MKIGILGAGSLGSVFGGMLAEGGHSVTMLSRSQEYTETVNRQGLFLTEDAEGKEDRSTTVRATKEYAELAGSELLIVLVNSFGTREAAKAALQAGAIGRETAILTLQNGLGNEEILQEIAGKERVITGRTYVSGRMLSPGRVMAAVRGCLTEIGELDGAQTERIRLVRDAFCQSGLETRIAGNIHSVIWEKLLVNVATGAISGITGLDYGGLYEKYGFGAPRELREIACKAVAEAMKVASAYQIPLSAVDPAEYWNRASKGQPPAFRASILQSLERGHRTEIDTINGAVVLWGRRAGVDTPVNEALTACIKGIEFRMDQERKKRG
ncbi:ketopantoate reductase family protein [Hominifimenecus sp. rT4P-3]|uniref:ketopantoate reductase family protein n=1 Tax=Hominifimenecus sp. rT4P-3 TaxID=3242979 RepID=UPI003DA53DEB